MDAERPACTDGLLPRFVLPVTWLMEFHLSLASPIGKLKERLDGDGERAPEPFRVVPGSPVGWGDVSRE